MFWQEDNHSEQFVVPDRIVDLLFSIDCKTLPVDHAHALSQALLAELAWFADVPEAGLHLIHVAESGNGWERPDEAAELLHLSRRTKLTLRLPKERVADAQRLTGITLVVAGNALVVGESKTRLLSSSSTLYARHVASAAGIGEEEFLAGAVNWLRGEGLRFKKIMCGKEHQIVTPDGALTTRSLMVADLSPADSVRLQESGYGAHRKLGCGLFIPHKTV